MPKPIPEEIIEQIRSKADIVDVIGSYVQLKRAGSNRYKGLCPFHNEKTPSFTVSVEKQMFHCFGCKKGGNVFTFVMEREGVDFPTAARMLADKYAIFIPDEQPWEPSARASSSGDVAIVPKNAKISKERLYKLNEVAAAFFESVLRGAPDSPVAKYLATRGLPKEIVERFRLGAAPDEWTVLLDHCKSKGFSESEILAAGLAKRHEEKKSVYDVFRNRLMFPVWDAQGRVVGFSGRVVSKDAFGGKYVNTPETWIFNKSRLLYPFPMAREGIRDKKQVVLCEGQMDAIAFHRGGVTNAVAPLGTAFTDEQATMLKHHTGSVVVAFDSDEAGRKAMFRAAELLLPKNVLVNVVEMPPGSDPDSIFNEKGPDELQRLVEGAVDFFDFAFRALSAEHDASTPEGKKHVSEELIRLIALSNSATFRSDQAILLAQRLGLPQQTIINELNRLRKFDKIRSDKSALSPGEAPMENTVDTASGAYPRELLKAETHLLEVALAHGTFAQAVAEKLTSDRITKAPVGRALELVISNTLNGEWELAQEALQGDQALAADPFVSKAMADPEFQDDDPEKLHAKQEKALNDCLEYINKYHDEKEMDSLMERLKTAPEEEKTEMMTRFKELSERNAPRSPRKTQEPQSEPRVLQAVEDGDNAPENNAAADDTDTPPPGAPPQTEGRIHVPPPPPPPIEDMSEYDEEEDGQYWTL